LTCSKRALGPLGLLATVFGAAAAPALAAPDSAYVANYGSGATGNTISEYTFGADQTLVPHGTIGSGNQPYFLEITPDARFLYSSNYGSAEVGQYSIGPDGTLSSLGTVASGRDPIGLAVSPDGHNAYVTNYQDGTLSVYDIGASGKLTLGQTVSNDMANPSAVAVSPDGNSVYVGDGEEGWIVEFSRAANGTLALKPTATITSGAVTGDATSVVMTPSGKNLYAISDTGSLIAGFTVGSDGELTANGTQTIPSQSYVYQLAVSPNGDNLYAPAYGYHDVYEYSIGSGGGLTAMTPSPATGSGPDGMWMTADGRSAYVSNYSSGTISQYNVSSTGALTAKTTPSVPSGSGPAGFVIPPDQGPVAAFTDPTARVGQTVQFDGSGSSDSDGTVARYDWSFGDGTTDPDGGPKVSHVYTKAGTYSVTLTVTDDSGCSTALVFTGQTAYCNASPGATLTRTVTIAAVKPKPSKLTARPRHAQAGKRTCFRFTFSSRGHGVRGATVRFAGHTAHTSRRGAARICLALHRGTYTARASKHGYRSARATVRITAAPRKAPAFTG
jgi:6-phosphogluconolactonase (cycloisomerase 2 family)